MNAWKSLKFFYGNNSIFCAATFSQRPITAKDTAMAGESGIDLNFDFIDFDCSVFEDDSTFSLLDKASHDVMFYELKSKTVPEETET